MFLVHRAGLLAKVYLQRSSAGWSAHVMTADDAKGSTVHLGHGIGPFENIDQAREAGTRIAVERISSLRGDVSTRGGFMVLATAIERENDAGNFDALLEVKDDRGQLTDRRFFKIINGERQSRYLAVETARRALDQIDGVSEDGKLIG